MLPHSRSDAPGNISSRLNGTRLSQVWARAIQAGSYLPQDAGLAGLRRAARAALIIPSALALAKLVGSNVQFIVLLAFGCFALIVFGDFGGRRPARAAAYVSVTLVGAALVALGSLLSPVAWQAALGMFIVGFCVQFAGVFGSYAAAAQIALQLSFMLPASIPIASNALGARLGGWCCAGVLATLAGVFLWPRFERTALQREAATALRALAALIAAERQGGTQPDLSGRQTAAQAAVGRVRQSYTATPKRPAGPARRDRAFCELLVELERLQALLAGLLEPLLRTQHPCLAEGTALLVTITRTLEASADLLVGGGAPDLSALEAARLAHRQALDRWAETAVADGVAPATILDSLQADDALRTVSYLALIAAADAVIVTGGQIEVSLDLPVETPRRAGAFGLLRRLASTIVTHLEPASPVLHSSLRVGLGLALAVLCSRELQLSHSFWVVLATLSVLRTNALATRRTTVQALTGTTAGFILSAAFILAVGRHVAALWLALPVAVFLSSYAASTVGFLAGQAAFTVTVVILFNLISPAGWQIGLVRVEDVALGTGISLAVGLLLWPRGALGELRRTLAELLASDGQFLGRTFDYALQHGTQEELLLARVHAARAYIRAGEALDQLMREYNAHPLEPQFAAALVTAGGDLLVAGDLLSTTAAEGYQTSGNADGLMDLQGQAQALVATFERLAMQLDTLQSGEAMTGPQAEMVRDAIVRLLCAWEAHATDGHTVIAAVTLAEWLQALSMLAAGLEQPVAATIEAARVPWWR